MAKKTNEPFDPSAWLNQAPATKEEKREKRKAEREEKKKESNKKAKIPKKKKQKENDNKFNLKYGIFVGACVVALAGSGAWAFVSHNGNAKYNAELVSTAQSEVQKAKEEAEQEEEKKYSLTKEEYDKNVDIIAKGIKTLSLRLITSSTKSSLMTVKQVKCTLKKQMTRTKTKKTVTENL